MARKGSFGDFVSTLHFIIPQYVHQKKLKKIQTAEFVFKIKRLICTASRLISVGTLWDICTCYNLSKSAEEQRLVVICNTALSLCQPNSHLTSDASRIWKSSIHCLFEKKRACSELCVRLYSRAGSNPQCDYLAGSQLILRLRLARQCFREPFALDLRAHKLAREYSRSKRRRYKPQTYFNLL